MEDRRGQRSTGTGSLIFGAFISIATKGCLN